MAVGGAAARLFVSVDADVGRAMAGLKATDMMFGKSAHSAHKFDAQVRKTAASTAMLNRATKAMAIGVGVGAAAVAYGMYKSARAAGDFEKSMRNVNSIARMSEPQFKGMGKAILTLAGQVGQTPKSLADGLYDLASSGFSATDSLTILKSSSKAATAGLTNTAVSTKAVAAVLNAYRLPASKAAKVSDELFQTVNLGVLTFEELASQIGDVLPFASTLGVGLDQVGASVTTLTKAGINAPETMTRIKAAMIAMIRPTDGMKAAYDSLGVESGEALIKQRGFQGAMEAVVKTAGGSKEKLAKLFPEVRGLGAALALTGKNAAGASRDLKGFKNTGGATNRVFKEQSKSAAFAAQKLKANWDVTKVIAGSATLPRLADTMSRVTRELQRMASDGSLERFGVGMARIANAAVTFGLGFVRVTGALVSSKTAMTALATVAGALAGRMVALGAVWAVGKISAFVSALGTARAAMMLFAETGSLAAFTTGGAGLAAMAGPIGLIVGGLLAGSVALGIWAQKSDDIAGSASRAATAIRGMDMALKGLQTGGQEITGLRHQLDSLNAQIAQARQQRDKLPSGSLDRRASNASIKTMLDQELDLRIQIDAKTRDQAKHTDEVATKGREITKGLEKRTEYNRTAQKQADKVLNTEKMLGVFSGESLENKKQLVTEAGKLTVGLNKASIATQSIVKRYASFKMPNLTTTLQTKDGGALQRLNAFAKRLDEIKGKKATANILANSKNFDDAYRRVEKALGDTEAAKVTATLRADNQQLILAAQAAQRKIDNLHGKTVQIQANYRVGVQGNLPKLPGVPQIKTKAMGGRGSGMTLVGEQGPELVDLPYGSLVHTASSTRRMLTAMGIEGMAKGGKKKKKGPSASERADKRAQRILSSLDFRNATGGLTDAAEESGLAGMLKGKRKIKHLPTATKRDIKQRLYDMRTSRASQIADLGAQASAVGASPVDAAKIEKDMAKRHLDEAKRAKDSQAIAQAELDLKSATKNLEDAERDAAAAVRQQQIDSLDAGIALAKLTPAIEDDIAAAQAAKDYWTGQLNTLLGDSIDNATQGAAIAEAANNIAGATDAIAGFAATVVDNSSAIKDLTAEMEKTRKFATATTNINTAEVNRAVLDWIADKLGARIGESQRTLSGMARY